MKQISVLLIAAFLLVASTDQVNAQAASTSNYQSTGTNRQLAREGDKVWVIINHVKADKRQQFERFVNEVFWPMASKLSADEQRVFRQTRVLNPTEAEQDGTYSYVFIMDPVIEGGNYNIEHLLEKMYGEAKAKEYGKMFEETAAREQTQYVLTQSRY